MPDAGRYSFRSRHRLHAGREFDRAYNTGARTGDALFAVNAVPNGRGHARLGMSVATKTVGNSVKRNRLRRTIRELFRHRLPELPALDLVVTSRPGVLVASRDEVLASLERLIAVAVRKACTDTSRSMPNPASKPKDPR